MAPVSGKGCTYTSCAPEKLEVYATHRPSGENLEFVAYVGMNCVGFWPAPGNSIHNLAVGLAGSAAKSSVPSGAHVSGLSDNATWSSPVRNSEEPGVSARCEKRPQPPSRSDANTMRAPSRVHMGLLFRPIKVKRTGAAAP